MQKRSPRASSAPSGPVPVGVPTILPHLQSRQYRSPGSFSSVPAPITRESRSRSIPTLCFLKLLFLVTGSSSTTPGVDDHALPRRRPRSVRPTTSCRRYCFHRSDGWSASLQLMLVCGTRDTIPTRSVRHLVCDDPESLRRSDNRRSTPSPRPRALERTTAKRCRRSNAPRRMFLTATFHGREIEWHAVYVFTVSVVMTHDVRLHGSAS